MTAQPLLKVSGNTFPVDSCWVEIPCSSVAAYEDFVNRATGSRATGTFDQGSAPMSEQPEWLHEFTDSVCACLHLMEGTPPIGCHVAYVADCWEVSLFVSPTEIVGGQHDGERLPCLFLLDALEVQHLFDVVDAVTWQPHQLHDLDELASHLSVSGYVGGRHVWLRILGEAPQRFESGRIANVLEQRILEKWDE